MDPPPLPHTRGSGRPRFKVKITGFRLKSSKHSPPLPDCGDCHEDEKHPPAAGKPDGTDNSSTSPQSALFNVNNIYIIGDIVNASIVKLGESSFGKKPHAEQPHKKPKAPSAAGKRPTECNILDVKPTKTRMPEYFEKSGSTESTLPHRGFTSQLTLHDRTPHSTEASDHVEITCHCPSKVELNVDG